MVDYLIVGAGLFGAVFAREAKRQDRNVLVVDRRTHIGGNCYTGNADGINVHTYGAHILGMSKRAILDYIRQFAEFNHFVNSPIV